MKPLRDQKEAKHRQHFAQRMILAVLYLSISVSDTLHRMTTDADSLSGGLTGLAREDGDGSGEIGGLSRSSQLGSPSRRGLSAVEMLWMQTIHTQRP